MADQLPDLPGGPQLRTVAMPAGANAGGSSAAERAGARVVTVAIDAMRFLRPAAVGDEVSCHGSAAETGETSVEVRIETWARGRGREKAPEKVTEGVVTSVAVAEDGHPRPLAAGGS